MVHRLLGLLISYFVGRPQVSCWLALRAPASSETKIPSQPMPNFYRYGLYELFFCKRVNSRDSAIRAGMSCFHNKNKNKVIPKFSLNWSDVQLYSQKYQKSGFIQASYLANFGGSISSTFPQYLNWDAIAQPAFSRIRGCVSRMRFARSSVDG
jgi:hypothetical protein